MVNPAPEPDADRSLVFAPSSLQGWLPRVFPNGSQLSIGVRSVIASAAVLGIEYLVEVMWLDLSYWRKTGAFFTEPGVVLSAFGLVFGFVLAGQWGHRYIELWRTVRPAFNVSDERYATVVGRSLDGLYGRDHVPFLLFIGIQIGVYTLFGNELPAGYLHVGFLHFLGVTALYSFYRHTVAIQSITALELTDIEHARPILSEIADFSVAACLNWFGALAAISIYLGYFMGIEREVGLFYALLTIVFVVVGLLLFIIPIVLLHDTLAEAKRDRLRELQQDYDTLFAEWRDGSLEGDPSVGLEILETRRRNIKSISTWPYQLLSIGKLALGSVIPPLISLVQVLGG